jgi:hypothetical protein
VLRFGILYIAAPDNNDVFRRFGGELNVQSSFYLLGLMIVFSLTMGITHVKQTRKHRKWMLRELFHPKSRHIFSYRVLIQGSVTYTSVPVTARLAAITSRHIISRIGTYYSVHLIHLARISAIIDAGIWQVWRCDEVLAALTRGGSPYPPCAVADQDLGSVHVAVRAAVNEWPLGFASSVRVTFGMALWVATVIHVIGVEIYVRIMIFFSCLS